MIIDCAVHINKNKVCQYEQTFSFTRGDGMGGGNEEIIIRELKEMQCQEVQIENMIQKKKLKRKSPFQ